MNREHQLSALTGGLLGLATAAGSIGCLLSAFGLTLTHAGILWGAVFLLTLIYGQCLGWKQGPLAFGCLLALILGYLWRQGAALAQTKALLQQLSEVYDRAYHWGTLSFGAVTEGSVDLPLGIWAAVIALAAVRSVCLTKRCHFPVLAALVPLAACVVVTDTVPDEKYLFLLLAGLLLLVLPASVRREDKWQSLRLTAAAFLPVTLSLAGLFLAIPQKSYVNQTAFIQENLRTAAAHFPTLWEEGLTDTANSLRGIPARQVDLSRLGQRIPFTYPVMEVTAEKSGTLYLREQDYDQYDGYGWTASENRQEDFSRQEAPQQTVTIRTRGAKQVRYLPYYPAAAVRLTGGRLENPEKETEYSLACSSLPDNWRQTAFLTPQADIPDSLQPYLALPEATRQAATEYLEQSFRPDASPSEKADIIAALVTDCAAYDLDPEKMPADRTDFALWFLQEAEGGYCIHFATTATVLLRSAGIPARYVTGYLAEVSAGKAVTVTEEDSHAWAEYYAPNLGCWIPLEATPAAEETAPLPTVPTTIPTLAATEPEPLETIPTAPSLPAQTIPDPPAVAEKSRSSPLVYLLLVPVGAFFLAVQRSVRLELRRKRQRRGSANTQALQRFREAERLARLLKETPAEELIELAQKAKYSQHEITPEELLAFDSYCRSCLRRLKEKPFWLQLLYRYFYAAY